MLSFFAGRESARPAARATEIASNTFISLFLDDSEAERRGGPREIGHLKAEILGHRLAGPLVCVKHFMAEGRSVNVKCHHGEIGLGPFDLPADDVYKAENGVGRKSHARREIPDSVKCPVGQAVSVGDKQSFHIRRSSLRIHSVSKRLYTRPALTVSGRANYL